MAVAHDATSNVSPTSSSSASWTHTPVGTPTLALLWVQFDSATIAVSGTPTYGGQDMALVSGPIRENQSTLYLYQLENPPSSAQTVAYDLTGSSFRHGAAQTFTGTRLSGAVGTPETGTGSVNPSETVASASGDLVVDGVGWRQSVLSERSVSADAGQTERYNSGASGRGLACSDEPGAASVVMSWTFNSTTSTNAVHIAVNLLAPEFRDAAVAIGLTTTMAVASNLITLRDAAVAIALSTTMAVSAGVATVVNAAVSIALTTTVSVQAGLLTFRNAYLANRYRKLVLDAEPLAYWRMGAASGDIPDEVGSNDLADQGSPTYSVAGALVNDPDTAVGPLDNTNYFRAASGLGSGHSGFSFESWVRWPGSLPGTNPIWMSTSLPFAAALVSGPNWFMSWRDSGGSQRNLAAASGPSPNQWYHVVIQHDGTWARICVDGQEVASTDSWDFDGAFAVAPFLGRHNGTGNPSDALIDEVAVYDYALSPEQIASHYTMGAVLGGIRIQTTMAVAAGVVTFVHAAVSIALTTTMSVAARIRSFLIPKSRTFRITGVRHDPKRDRVTWDGEEV